MGIEYKFERHRIDKLRKDQVLPILLAAAKHFNYVEFSIRDFTSARLGVSRSGVESAFGSWSEAMEALRLALKAQGLSMSARPMNRIADTQLFSEMESIWAEIGHRPSRYEWEASKPRFSYQTYKNRFGGWTNACLRFLEWRMGKPVTIDVPRQKEDATTEQPVPPDSQPTDVSRRGASDRLRLRVLDRDGFRCVLCGRSPAIERGVMLQLDHIVPFSKGGLTTLENLRTVCERCNQGRGNLAELAKRGV